MDEQPEPSQPCPRCGYAGGDLNVCDRCGLIFAKFKGRPTGASHSLHQDQPNRSSGRGVLWGCAIVCAAVIAGTVGFLRGTGRLDTPRGAPRPSASTPLTSPQPSTTPSLRALSTPSNTDVGSALRVTAADYALSQRLRAKLNPLMSPVITAEDLRVAEGLYERYPENASIAEILDQALRIRARNVHQGGNDAAAEEFLVRACALAPSDKAPRMELLALQLSRSEWPAAEQTARATLALDPDDPNVLAGLGLSLMRQGRDREAKEVLARAGTTEAGVLLGKVEKDLSHETGMREQRLGAFTLKYEGEAHDAVGNEVLRVLERHYATLTMQFDHRPASAIQVILYTQEKFQEASDAPSWAGGVFDTLDGRVRVPVGGLTATLSPYIESVLLHELTHAFVADMTNETAPRELQEGLAQHMEGKRLDTLVPGYYLTALADGRVTGVPALYLGALSLVEYLLDQRGQGGINELLETMGATHSCDAACRAVYGQSFGELQEAARARLRQRYGS